MMNNDNMQCLKRMKEEILIVVGAQIFNDEIEDLKQHFPIEFYSHKFLAKLFHKAATNQMGEYLQNIKDIVPSDKITILQSTLQSVEGSEKINKLSQIIIQVNGIDLIKFMKKEVGLSGQNDDEKGFQNLMEEKESSLAKKLEELQILNQSSIRIEQSQKSIEGKQSRSEKNDSSHQISHKQGQKGRMEESQYQLLSFKDQEEAIKKIQDPEKGKLKKVAHKSRKSKQNFSPNNENKPVITNYVIEPTQNNFEKVVKIPSLFPKRKVLKDISNGINFKMTEEEQIQLIVKNQSTKPLLFCLNEFFLCREKGTYNHLFNQEELKVFYRIIKLAIDRNPIDMTILLQFLISCELDPEKRMQAKESLQKKKKQLKLQKPEEPQKYSENSKFLKIFIHFYTNSETYEIYKIFNSKLNEKQYEYFPMIVASLMKGIQDLAVEFPGMINPIEPEKILYRLIQDDKQLEIMHKDTIYSWISFTSASFQKEKIKRFAENKMHRRQFNIKLDPSKTQISQINYIAFCWQQVFADFAYDEQEIIILPIFNFYVENFLKEGIWTIVSGREHKYIEDPQQQSVDKNQDSFIDSKEEQDDDGGQEYALKHFLDYFGKLCDEAGDNDLKRSVLGKPLRDVKQLKFSGTNFNEEGVDLLIDCKWWKWIEIINLSDCPKITPESMKKLLNAYNPIKFPCLKTIIVSNINEKVR